MNTTDREVLERIANWKKELNPDGKKPVMHYDFKEWVLKVVGDHLSSSNVKVRRQGPSSGLN